MERAHWKAASRSGAELPRYHQDARFIGEHLAETTYVAAQDALFAHAGDVDLSAYRVQLNRVDHVVIVGDPPTGRSP